MAFVLPIKELLEAGSPKGACGILDPVNEAQVDVLFESVRKEKDPNLHRLRQVAEGLFRGGDIPDLSSAKDGDARVQVKPIKHLKVAMVLTLAGLGMEGIRGFSDGLVLIESLLKTQWENVYPVAEAKDLDDPYYRRVNILSPLSIADPAKAVTLGDSWRIYERLLKAVLLVSERHGALSVRDCLSPWRNKTIRFGDDPTKPESMRLSLPDGEDRSPEFVQEVRSTSAEMVPRQREALQNAIGAVKDIRRIFDDVPGIIKPTLDYLLSLLTIARNVLDGAPTVVQATNAESKQTKLDALENTAPPSGLQIQSSGPVSSREEALRKLSEIADYFRRTEPSSPVSALIDRAKNLAGKDFMALVEQLQLGEAAEKEFAKLAGVQKKSS